MVGPTKIDALKYAERLDAERSNVTQRFNADDGKIDLVRH